MARETGLVAVLSRAVINKIEIFARSGTCGSDHEWIAAIQIPILRPKGVRKRVGFCMHGLAARRRVWNSRFLYFVIPRQWAIQYVSGRGSAKPILRICRERRLTYEKSCDLQGSMLARQYMLKFDSSCFFAENCSYYGHNLVAGDISTPRMRNCRLFIAVQGINGQSFSRCPLPLCGPS